MATASLNGGGIGALATMLLVHASKAVSIAVIQVFGLGEGDDRGEALASEGHRTIV